MELEDYTLETFLNNFKKDKEVFGEDTKYIYEELFSDIMQEDVQINEEAIDAVSSALMFGVISEEAIEEKIFTESIFSKLFGNKNPGLDKFETDLSAAKKAEREARKAYKAAENAYRNQEVTAAAVKKAEKTLMKAQKNASEATAAVNALGSVGKDVAAAGGLGPSAIDAVAGPAMAAGPEAIVAAPAKVGFFTRLRNKINTFLGGLKGRSFTEIMNNGFAWLKNPANMAKALATSGGIILIIIILRALKKRRKINQYKKLQQVSRSVQNEDFEPELSFQNGSSEFGKAKNELLRECCSNKILHDSLFGPLNKETKKVNYFDY